MSTTALTILKASFFDIGVIQEGEELGAAMAQDGLSRLNNMVSGWQTQYGTVTAIERQVFALTANQQTYTIGIGAEFNVPRPLTIEAAGLWLNGLSSPQSVTSITRSGVIATVTSTSHGFSVGDEAFIAGAAESLYNGLQTVQTVPTADTFTCTLDGRPTTPATGTLTVAAVNGVPVEIPRPVITDSGYQQIQLKNMPNQQFTVVYYNPTYPYGTVYLWPLPDVATNQLVLYLQNVFPGFVDLTTPYDWPSLPGYAEALQYNLDLRLAIPYKGTVSDEIHGMAVETLGMIKRANNKLYDLPSDAALLTGDRRGGYNILTGQGGQ